MRNRGWSSWRVPNTGSMLDELDLHIQESLPADRAHRITDGRVVTGGFRMTSRRWRQWRRLLDRLDHDSRRGAKRA